MQLAHLLNVSVGLRKAAVGIAEELRCCSDDSLPDRNLKPKRG